MATFVLVHPAWFGTWCWRQVTPSYGPKGRWVKAYKAAWDSTSFDNVGREGSAGWQSLVGDA